MQQEEVAVDESGGGGLRGGLFALFLAATAGIFVLWHTRPQDYLHGEPTDTITVDSETAAELEAAPNAVFGNALNTALAEEIYVRDGVSMGLARTDTIVRQRIIQQQSRMMVSAEPSISENDLRTWFEAHSDRFRVPRTYGFEHRFFRRTNRDELASAVAAVLDSQTLPPEVGDPFVHGTTFASQSANQIEGLFGREFSRAIADSSLNNWAGPVTSNFGQHMIRVEAVTESSIPDFESVRDAAYAAWAGEERKRELNEALGSLRDRYTIVGPEGRTHVD